LSDKKLDIRATYWLTPTQSEEYLRLRETVMSDWEAINKATQNYPETDEIIEAPTPESKPKTAIYVCPPLPDHTSMELDFVPTFFTRELMETELQRMIEEAKQEHDNPLHRVQDVMLLWEQPNLEEDILQCLMDSDQMSILLSECEGQLMELADEGQIQEYEEKSFYSFLLGLEYLVKRYA